MLQKGFVRFPLNRRNKKIFIKALIKSAKIRISAEKIKKVFLKIRLLCCPSVFYNIKNPYFFDIARLNWSII